MATPRPIKVDFTNVEDASQFNTKHIEPGEYVGKVKSIEDKEAKGDGGDMWLVSITLDKVPGAVYPYYIKLDFSGPKGGQAWKLRQLATACGFAVPRKAISINPAKLIGKKLGVSIEEEEYQGRMKGVVQRLIPLSEVAGPQEVVEDDDDDEDDAPPPVKTTRRRKPAPEPEPEEDDEDDLDEEEEEEEETPAPRKRAPAKKVAARRKPAPVVEDDDEDDLDLDEI